MGEVEGYPLPKTCKNGEASESEAELVNAAIRAGSADPPGPDISETDVGLAESFMRSGRSHARTDSVLAAVSADPLAELFPPPKEIELVAETESAPLPFRPLSDAIAEEPDEPAWCWQDYAARSS